MMNTKQRAMMAGMMLAVCHAEVTAAVLSVGNVSIPEGSLTAQVPIYLTGGDSFSSLVIDFGMQSGPVPIPITGFSAAGGILDQSGYGLSAVIDPAALPTDLPLLIDLTITAPGLSAVANGLIGTITLDTSGLVAGQQFIYSSNYEGAWAAMTNLGIDGTLTFATGELVVTAIPEPAQAGALLLAAGLVHRRRNRSR